MTKRVDELVLGICGTETHPLAPPLRRWCQTSRAFLAFAEAHLTKIRKKARLAPSADEHGDVFAELAVAALLLRDPRFAVCYEPGQASGRRGPDFQAIFKTHTALYVEVTRLRLQRVAGEDAALKLARVLCDKIGQFPSGAVNVLGVIVPPDAVGEALVPTALRLLDGALRREAALRVPSVGLERAGAFQRRRPQLSAVALWSLTSDGQPRHGALWLNPQARHPLPPDIAKSLLSAPGTQTKK